jgi:hypothetical protein
MTTELEKQFFDTFGIESKLNDCNWQCQKPSKLIYMCANNNDCEHCKEYPQITDKILLKLICYMTVQQYQLVISNKRTIDDLKKYILKKCIKDYSKNEYLKHQVQAIFKGENGF